MSAEPFFSARQLRMQMHIHVIGFKWSLAARQRAFASNFRKDTNLNLRTEHLIIKEQQAAPKCTFNDAISFITITMQQRAEIKKAKLVFKMGNSN